MANPVVIFVQGARTKERKFPWMYFHFHPSLDRRPAPVELVFFDILHGEIRTWKSWTAPRAAAILTDPPPDTVVPLLPQVRLRLEDGSLDAGPARSSVVGIYDYIRALPARSVVSFQVFSHGGAGGAPILWGTPELDDATGARLDPRDRALPRDPHDTDFRPRDFFGANPAADPAFRAAFADDAFIKLWGADFDRDQRDILARYWIVPGRRTPRTESRRGTHLTEYLDAVEQSFPMAMAQQLGKPVWAAPTGFCSTPWEHEVRYRGTFPPSRRENWWRVTSQFHRGKKDKGARFYTEVLAAEIDALGYVAFDDSWLQIGRARAAMLAASAATGAPRELRQRLLDRIAARQPRFGTGGGG